MGMFDTVRCELPLPGEPKPTSTAWLQTKDFHCYLDTYTIKADGTLQGPNGPMPFHGMMNFYTFDGPDLAHNGMWFEYEAKFTDGKLDGIECVCIERTLFGNPDHEVIYRRLA